MADWLKKKADTFHEYTVEEFRQRLKTDKPALLSELADWLHGGMFGDGMEMEYIMGGIQFKGLGNMTDEELVAEAQSSGLIIGEE